MNFDIVKIGDSFRILLTLWSFYVTFSTINAEKGSFGSIIPIREYVAGVNIQECSRLSPRSRPFEQSMEARVCPL